MSLFSLISLSVAMLILAASPGPGVFATVARSLASGFRPAMAVIIGIVVGDIIYLMFAIFGLSIVAQTLGEFFIIIRVCGGIYLFWLGLKIWFSKPPETESKQLYEKQSQLGNIISGLLITLSNPKVILFYCGFLPTFLDLSTLNVIDIALITCVITIVLTTVLTIYAGLASHARQLLSSPKAIKRLNRSAGGVMMATGVIISTKA
ncbi:MAG: lysine transporter [Desulfobacteraceae bacterium 4484_190.1]|nr:MAG: lysine transporter [Desulfobacteraceae bacterium 4484_190.1]